MAVTNGTIRIMKAPSGRYGIYVEGFGFVAFMAETSNRGLSQELQENAAAMVKGLELAQKGTSTEALEACQEKLQKMRALLLNTLASMYAENWHKAEGSHRQQAYKDIQAVL